MGKSCKVGQREKRKNIATCWSDKRKTDHFERMKKVSVKRKAKVSRRLWSQFVVILIWYFKSSSVTPQRLIASLCAIPSRKSSWEQRNLSNFSQGIKRPIFNSQGQIEGKWLLRHSSWGVWYAIEDLYGCNREAAQRSTQPQLCLTSRFEAVRVLWWCEVHLVSKKRGTALCSLRSCV